MCVHSGVCTGKDHIKKSIWASFLIVVFPSFIYLCCRLSNRAGNSAIFDQRHLDILKHTDDGFDMDKSFHHIQYILFVVYLYPPQTLSSDSLCRGSEVRGFWLQAAEDSLFFPWAVSSCFAALHSSQLPGVNVVWVTFRRNTFSPQIWHKMWNSQYLFNLCHFKLFFPVDSALAFRFMYY